MQESRIIPDPMHAEVTVNVQLPPEATALMRDLHKDRDSFFAGGAIALFCLVALTIKRLASRRG